MEVARWRVPGRQRERQLRKQVPRWRKLQRSLERQQEQLWWLMVEARARLVVQQPRQRSMLVDLLHRRLEQLVRQRQMPMRGTLGSMRVAEMVVWRVLGLHMWDLWERMRVQWVLRLLRQEEHLHRQLRRRLNMRRRQEQAKQTWRRQQDWLLEVLWLRMEGLWRMWVVLQARQL